MYPSTLTENWVMVNSVCGSPVQSLSLYVFQ